MSGKALAMGCVVAAVMGLGAATSWAPPMEGSGPPTAREAGGPGPGAELRGIRADIQQLRAKAARLEDEGDLAGAEEARAQADKMRDTLRQRVESFRNRQAEQAPAGRADEGAATPERPMNRMRARGRWGASAGAPAEAPREGMRGMGRRGMMGQAGARRRAGEEEATRPVPFAEHAQQLRERVRQHAREGRELRREFRELREQAGELRESRGGPAERRFGRWGEEQARGPEQAPGFRGGRRRGEMQEERWLMRSQVAPGNGREQTPEIRAEVRRLRQEVRTLREQVRELQQEIERGHRR